MNLDNFLIQFIKTGEITIWRAKNNYNFSSPWKTRNIC